MSYKTRDNEISDWEESVDEDNSIIKDINDSISELHKFFFPTDGSFQLEEISITPIPQSFWKFAYQKFLKRINSDEGITRNVNKVKLL